MGVSQDHSELVAHRHARDHVADRALDSTQHSVSLLLLQPHSELQGVAIALFGGLLADVDGDVLERTLQGAEGALHGDIPGLDVHGDALRHDQLLLRYDVLHDK